MSNAQNKYAKLALDAALAKWGNRGWDNLTQDMREAFIAREAVHLLMSQDDSMTKFSAGKDLVLQAMAAAYMKEN